MTDTATDGVKDLSLVHATEVARRGDRAFEDEQTLLACSLYPDGTNPCLEPTSTLAVLKVRNDDGTWERIAYPVCEEHKSLAKFFCGRRFGEFVRLT